MEANAAATSERDQDGDQKRAAASGDESYIDSSLNSIWKGKKSAAPESNNELKARADARIAARLAKEEEKAARKEFQLWIGRAFGVSTHASHGPFVRIKYKRVPPRDDVPTAHNKYVNRAVSSSAEQSFQTYDITLFYRSKDNDVKEVNAMNRLMVRYDTETAEWCFGTQEMPSELGILAYLERPNNDGLSAQTGMIWQLSTLKKKRKRLLS